MRNAHAYAGAHKYACHVADQHQQRAEALVRADEFCYLRHYRAGNQRYEQALRHSAKGVDEVTFCKFFDRFAE